MNSSKRRRHPIDSLFTVVLLGLFLIFLLVMLLFSAQAYRTAVAEDQQNNNLYTASAYITAKFRQHDNSQSISTDTIDDIPAFCMTDTINGQQYITYIYLKDHHLKELFTSAGNTPSAQMGTDIAELNDSVSGRKQMDFTASPLQTRMGIPAVCCYTLVFRQGDFNHEKNNHTLKIQPIFNGNDSFHSHSGTDLYCLHQNFCSCKDAAKRSQRTEPYPRAGHFCR